MGERPVQTASRYYLSRKLHSVLGVVPVGLFLIEHFITNSTALFGAATYDRAALTLQSVPGIAVIEVLLIFAPLLFHAILGVKIYFEARNNPMSYSHFRNWMFFLQRLTGIFTFVFVGYHVWQFRIAKFFTGQDVTYQTVAHALASPWMAAFYALGVVAAAFHLANGLWSFGITWGITVGQSSQRRMAYVWSAFFVLMSLLGVAALRAFMS